MTDPLSRLRRFLRELKRRNVYKVATTYAVVGFVLIQIADLTFIRLGLPSWTVTFVIVLVAVGFPLAIILAWAFERTPEGVRRTPEAEPAEESAPEAGQGLSTGYKVLVGLGLLGAAVAGGWYMTGGGESTANAPLGERSVAVLPFEAHGREQPGTFTAGMHDALLARLSNVSGLKVISRTAVEPFRGTDKTTGEIARELGVRWVLEGGVQEMGEQIQVNAQLIDPRTETHAWAETYRRDLTAEGLFALQSEITKKIARSLEARLTSAEQERVERRPTENLDAYRLYVRGRALMASRSVASIDSARGYFQRALQEDSTYALAWAGLADARTLYADFSTVEESDEAWVRAVTNALPETRVAARKALELDPKLAEAHASLGLFYMQKQRVKPAQRTGLAALRELRRAVELQPSYAQAHHWIGLLQLWLGRPESAREHVDLAVELDPTHNSARRVLVEALLATGNYEEALAEVRRFRERYPERVRGRLLHARVLLHLRRWRRVPGILRPYLSEIEGSTDTGARYLADRATSYLALADAGAGDTVSARTRLNQLRNGNGEGGLVHLALAYAAVRNRDAALSTLRKAYYEGSRRFRGFTLMILRYGFPDLLDLLRKHPRYEELMREINVAWGLNPDGSLPDSVDVSFGSETDE